MQKITFTKESLLFSFWDESTESWINKSLQESELPFTWFLPYQTYVESGVTLRQVLKVLEKYSPEINFVFVNYLKGMLLEDAIKMLDEAEPVKSSVEKVDAICLIWTGQMQNVANESEPYINIQPSLMALEIDQIEEDEDQFHEIFEVSIAQLLDSPLIMDDFIEFYDEDESDEVLLTGSTNWTLFDFTRALLGELIMYSYAIKVFPNGESVVKLPPMTADDLFDHLENLDNFFKRGKNDI